MGAVDDCQYGVGSSFAYVSVPYDMNVGQWIAVFYSLVPNTIITLFVIGYRK